MVGNAGFCVMMILLPQFALLLAIFPVHLKNVTKAKYTLEDIRKTRRMQDVQERLR